MSVTPEACGVALLVISHGSSVQPDCYEPVLSCVRTLREHSSFDEVAVGFLKQSPSLQQGWQSLRSDRVVVVPYLAAAGFFAARYLPKKLGLSDVRLGEVIEVDGRLVVYTEPVGTDPAMWSVVADFADQVPGRQAPDEEATLVVVGHGTPRHGASGTSVRDCVAHLRRTTDFREVLAAFVDEEPFVDAVLQRCPSKEVVVVPYFVANGPHVTEDIPRAMGIDGDPFENPHDLAEHRICFGNAVGISPGICDIVASRALKARQRLLHREVAMDDERRVRLQIYGRVQGVFFRASTREKARKLGVNGWVKNRRDGSVEALVVGPNDAVDELIEWAHQGPPHARVDRVEVDDSDTEGEFNSFEVRR